MNSGIYQIMNTLNDRIYVGSSVDIKNRLHRHQLDLEKGTHHSRFMQRDWNKNKSGFRFLTIKLLNDKTMLLDIEQHYLDILRPEYNSAPKAGSSLGIKRTNEFKQKLSKALSGSGNGMYGKHHSEEAKQKQRDAKKNYVPWNKGIKTGPESLETRSKKSQKAKLRDSKRKRLKNGQYTNS